MKIGHFWNAQAFFQIKGERAVFDTKIISHTHLNQNKHNLCKLMFFIVLDLVRKPRDFWTWIRHITVHYHANNFLMCWHELFISSLFQLLNGFLTRCEHNFSDHLLYLKTSIKLVGFIYLFFMTLLSNHFYQGFFFLRKLLCNCYHKF